MPGPTPAQSATRSVSLAATLPRKARGLACGCALLALFCVLLTAFPGLFTRLELSLSDLRYRLAARPLAHPDLVFVDIDDDSVRRFGKWPLARSAHARVLDILTDCGVSLGAYAIVFHGASARPGDGGAGEREDAALEAAMARNGRVVFPVGVGLVREPEVVRLTPDADDLPLLPSLLPPGQVHVPDLLQAETTFLPLARLSRRAIGLGHVAARAGDHATAADHYRQALAPRPDDAATLLALARSLLELGRRADGEAVLRDAARASPGAASQAISALAAASHGRVFLRPSAAARFLASA